MVGNISYINNRVKRNPKSPIKDLRIIEVINNEYWKEWRTLLHYSESPIILADSLGKWKANNNLLRRYVRNLIHQIRVVRGQDKYKQGQLPETIYHDKRVKEFRIAWKQLDNLRKTFRKNAEDYKLYLETQE